jgi:hypothetical protein
MVVVNITTMSDSGIAILQELMSVSEPVLKETIPVGKEVTFIYKKETKTPKREIEEIVKDISTKIVDPILLSQINDLKVKFFQKLDLFEPKLTELSQQSIRMKGEEGEGEEHSLLFKIAQSEFVMYELFKTLVLTRKDLNADHVTKIVQIIDNIRDYENILLGILIKRPNELKDALKQIDLTDLRKVRSEGFLAFYCISTLIEDKETYYDMEEKLSILLELGIEYSDKMVIYADTIDVSSNSEAMTVISKPDS